MAKKIKESDIAETDVKVEAAVARCESCGGTGRGVMNGVYETTCKTCKGTGK